MATTTLTSWALTHVGALYDAPAPDDAAFQASFDAVFSPQAQIITNHEPMTRDQLLETIRSRSAASTGTTIEWKDVFEVSKADETSSEEAGIVAGIFVVIRSLRFRIRVGPAQTKTAIVFSAKIESDPSVHEGDSRRIVQLFQTAVDQPVHIELHGGPVSGTTA